MCMEAGVSSRLRPLLAILVQCMMQMLLPKGGILLSSLQCHHRHALLRGVTESSTNVHVMGSALYLCLHANMRRQAYIAHNSSFLNSLIVLPEHL